MRKNNDSFWIFITLLIFAMVIAVGLRHVYSLPVGQASKPLEFDVSTMEELARYYYPDHDLRDVEFVLRAIDYDGITRAYLVLRPIKPEQ